MGTGMGKEIVLRYVGPCWCHGGPGTGCGPCCRHTCGHGPRPYAGSGSRRCWGGRRSDEQYWWISALFGDRNGAINNSCGAQAHFYTHMPAQLTHSSYDSCIAAQIYLMVFHQHCCNLTLHIRHKCCWESVTLCWWLSTAWVDQKI